MQARAKETSRTGRVQAIDRAFLLLGELLGAPQGLSALELATRTRLDRTTVHRLLRTLAHWGVTEANGARHRLGAQCLVLGNAHLDRLNLHRAALPYALELVQAGIGERRGIVSIAVPARDELVIIERVWSPRAPLSIFFEIGTRVPLERSPSGRAILSTWSPARCLALLGAKRYQALKPKLAEVAAAKGLSFGLSELRPGVTVMAAPLCGPGGEALGALLITGLDLEQEARPESKLAQHLLRAAKNVSAQLAGG